MSEFGKMLDMIIEDALRRTPEDKGIQYFLDKVLESANMSRARARYISDFLAERERQLIKCETSKTPRKRDKKHCSPELTEALRLLRHYK